MADDMELDVSTNIEVNGTNSIDQAAQKVEKLAGNADEAEKKVSGISSAFGKLASAVKDNSLVKTFEYITKNIIELNKELKETPEVLAKIGTAKEKYYQASHDERHRNWQMAQMVSKQTGVYKGDGFVMDTRRPSESPSVEKAISMARLRMENADIAAHHNISSLSNKSQPLHKSLTSFYNFNNGIDINYASKELDSAEEFFFEERLKMSIQKYKKGLQDILNKDKKQSSKVLLLEDLSHRDGNWYTGEKGFTTDFNTSVNEYGKAEFEKSSEEARARIQAAQEEEARIQEQKLEEQKKVLTNLMQQDPGRNVLLIGATEEAIAKAKEEELKAAEESVKAEKKGAKSSEMTAFQKEKIEAKAAEVAAYDKRTDKIAEENEKKQQRWEAQAGTREFRNKHPELFATGGQYFNRRYQTGGAFSNIGTKVSQLGTGGRLIGDLLQTIGMFVKSPIAGTATAISKLATGLIDLGKSATQAFAEIESIKTQLGVVFSNQTQAEDIFGQISKYAIKSPFGVQQTSELAVLLKQSGVYASDLMDTLKMLGDTAGGNMEKMKRIANNYAQIVSIGKASMLDMRQFAYAGIPIFEAVSKELKVSQQELRKMISDGKVTSDIIAKVFKDLTGINGIFNEATAKGAKTLKARLQNLNDAKQLALSSLGDSIVNAGSSRGNDSIVLNLVQKMEDFFSWAKEHQDVKNIERDVGLIANSNDRVKQLEDMLKFAEEQGNKDLQNLIKAELEYQKSVFTIEKQRQIYAGSYDVKNAEADRYREKYGEYDQEYRDSIAKLLGKAQSDYFNSNSSASGRLRGIGVYKELSDEERSVLRNQIEMYTMLTSELAAYAKALEKAKETTEEEIAANRERNLLNEQQAAFDRSNSFADSSSSYMASFKELNEIYKASDEYKEKQENERKKRLTEALDVLKQISKNTDPKTQAVDITKYSAKEFADLVRSGAIEPSGKLDVVRQDKPYSEEQRRLLNKQYSHYQTELQNFLKERKFSDSLIKKLNNNNVLNAISSKVTDDQYYLKFKDVWANQNDLIDAAIDEYSKKRRAEAGNAPAQYKEDALAQAEKDIEKFKNEIADYTFTLQQSLVPYTTLIEGELANVDMIETAGQQFVAFWKRLMSESTGLTTQSMTTPGAALSDYMSDIANRKLVTSVMGAVLSIRGVSSAVSLLKPTDDFEQKTLRNAGFAAFQVDWKKSAEALKKFTTQLSASTEVISAYRAGLEEEASALQNLILTFNNFETSDFGKSNKIVSVKALGKVAENVSDSQLVNAIGRTLSYNGNDVEIEGDKLFTTIDGVKTEITESMYDNLSITDDIYKTIEEYLPKIESAISETKLRERTNEELKTLIGKVLPNELSKMALASGDKNSAMYLLDNSEYLTDQFYNAYGKIIQDYKGNSAYGDVANLPVEDLIMQGLVEEGQAREILLAIVDAVVQEAETLSNGGGSTLAGLALSSERDQAAIAAFRKSLGLQTASTLNPNAWGDEGGYSPWTKFIGDLTGVRSTYSTSDYLNIGKASGGTMKRWGLFGKDIDWDAGLTDVYKDGERIEEGQEKLINSTLRWNKALLDTVDTMKSLGEETSDLVGQLGQKSFLTPFEKMGQQLINGKEWTEETALAMKDLGAEALSSLGPIMAKAGFELVARGAMDGNWAMIAGGLALAAAGGFASGLGGALSEGQNDTNDDKEAEKLESLKDDLAALLEQARRDALYYENNLRHKTALGINREFDYKSVNDAIITPQGDVITTDPKDYLIATKTPQQLGGGNVSVTPIINCNVINNTSAKVTQQQQQNADGSIDIVTIIEDVAGQFIASSKSDSAFDSRAYRLQGRQAVMS